MFNFWAVEAVDDDAENAEEVYQLGIFVARNENEAAHVALMNVPFDHGGSWKIAAFPVPAPFARSEDGPWMTSN